MKKYIRNIISMTLCVCLAAEMPMTVYANKTEDVVLAQNQSQSGEIALTQDNFPDSVFLKCIKDRYDTNLNGVLEKSEADLVTEMDLSGMAIRDLTGIEYFGELTSLDCSYNLLKNVDVDGLTKLEDLNQSYNAYLDTTPLLGDDVSSNSISENGIIRKENSVTVLQSAGQFQAIKLSEKNFPDEHFYEYLCNYIDVDGDNILSETELAETTVLDVSDQDIADLTGLEFFTNLVYLNCSDNQLEQLDVSANPYLVSLNCSDNFLPALSLEGNTELEELICEGNAADVTTVSENCIDLSLLPGVDYGKMHFDSEMLADHGSFYIKDRYLYIDDLTDGEFLPYTYDTGFEGAEVSFELCVNLPEQDEPTGESVSGNGIGGQENGSVSDNSVSNNSVSANTASFRGKDVSPQGAAGENTEQPQTDVEPKATEPEQVVVGTPFLNSAVNSSKGKVALSFTACENATGYEVEYSRVKNFSKNVVTLQTSNTSLTVTNMPKNKTYSFRVRAYRQNEDGTITYGEYSNAISVKIKKGSAEIQYSAKAGKLKSCKLTAQNTFQFTATVKKRVASSDDFYYLCQVDPYTDKKVRVITQVPKDTKIKITMPAVSDDGTNLIEGKYALCIKSGSKYKLITKSSYISNPKMAATYTAPFPTSASKKGIQGADGQSDLGVSHSLINIPFTDVIAKGKSGVPYEYNGKTYYFKANPYVGTIKRCNRDNITISAVFLMPWDDDLQSLITKKGRKPLAANYYALNMEQKAARETIEAAFMYLAELYSREDCHLDNWILGNEVNVPNPWNFAGNMSYNSYVANYAHAFRTLYYAAVSHNQNARVYISLDHNWTGSGSAYGAKDFMVNFNKELKAQNKSIRWNLAYHAYPVPLTASAFWNNTLATDSADSRYVTLKNLTVLTKFVKKKFGSKTRIILSEQGFTSTAGENTQAAAIAYGYYKAEFNSMIDAYIIRSDIDNEVETAQGLKMGLRNIDGTHKVAYNVFKYMDTPQYETYTNWCLQTIGKASWKKAVKGFKDSKLKSMPNRA